MKPAVSADDMAIVDLIQEGLTRWAIAERLDLSESSVRLVIRRLCETFECSMRDLPDVIAGR